MAKLIDYAADTRFNSDDILIKRWKQRNEEDSGD
jgi:hypothetical protein